MLRFGFCPIQIFGYFKHTLLKQNKTKKSFSFLIELTQRFDWILIEHKCVRCMSWFSILFDPFALFCTLHYPHYYSFILNFEIRKCRPWKCSFSKLLWLFYILYIFHKDFKISLSILSTKVSGFWIPIAF